MLEKADAILIGGGLLICLPIYFAIVAGTLTLQEVQQIPLPWFPGDQLLENLSVAWTKGNFGRLMLNSFR